MSSTPTSSTAVRIPGAALWSRAPDLIEGAIRSMVALSAADFEAIFSAILNGARATRIVGQVALSVVGKKHQRRTPRLHGPTPTSDLC